MFTIHANSLYRLVESFRRNSVNCTMWPLVTFLHTNSEIVQSKIYLTRFYPCATLHKLSIYFESVEWWNSCFLSYFSITCEHIAHFSQFNWKFIVNLYKKLMEWLKILGKYTEKIDINDLITKFPNDDKNCENFVHKKWIIGFSQIFHVFWIHQIRNSHIF